MILIITEKFDPHADFVIEELNRQKIECLRIHLSDFPQRLQIHIDTDSSLKSKILYRETEYDLKNITSVWYRRTEKVQVPINLSTEDQEIAFRESNAMIRGFFQSLRHCLWVSHPDYISQASSKLDQLIIAKQFGFNTAPTCFSNNPILIKEFYEDNVDKSKIIYKPHTPIMIPTDNNKMGVVYSSIVTKVELERLDEIVSSPGIFQAYIEKECDVRVTVFGNRLFACKIHSQSKDETVVDCRASSWVEGNLPLHEAIDLPKEIHNSCLEMVEHYRLMYSAIDLVIAKNGDFYFLELNPNGQWAWIEDLTGQPMRDSLINLLNTRGNNNERQ